MQLSRIAELFLRLWAVTLAVRGVVALPAMLITMRSLADVGTSDGAMIRASQFGGLVSVLVTLVAAVVVFAAAPVLSPWLLRADGSVHIGVTAVDLFRCGVVLVGVFLIAQGVRDLAVVGYVAAARPSWDETGTFEYVWNRYKEQLAAGGATLLVGASLIGLNTRLGRYLQPPHPGAA